MVDGDGGHAVGLGLFDGHASGLLGDHEPEPPIAVDDSGAGGLLDYFKGSAGDYMPDVDTLHISRRLDDSVGVVPGEVGFDQVPGHRLGFVVRSAFGAVDVVGNFMQIFGRENGHISTSEGKCH